MRIRDLINIVETAQSNVTHTYYHGTTSTNAEIIQQHGFKAPSYFTTSFEDAEYYAGTGGEWDLQRREEEWEEENGYSPRDEYDAWEMFKILYPEGAYPVVIEVSLTPEIIATGRPDAGANGGLVFDQTIPAEYITKIHRVEWPDYD